MQRIHIFKYTRQIQRAAKNERDLNKRRDLMMAVAELRMLILRLDHLGGMWEVFMIEDALVVRQEIIRDGRWYWYNVIQNGDIELASNIRAGRLEKAYVRSLGMG